MSAYNKTIGAVLLGIGTWGSTAAPDGITASEGFGLLIALAGAFGVYAVKNSEAPKR